MAKEEVYQKLHTKLDSREGAYTRFPKAETYEVAIVDIALLRSKTEPS